MTKRDMIELALCNDLELSTATVINKVKVEYGIDVSPRHVQRIRKEMVNETTSKGKNKMGVDENVYETKGINEWQLNLINMVNEPTKGENFWSIQELATILEKTDTEVRETLEEWGYLVSNTVLDESNSNVIALPHKPEMDNKKENKSASGDDYWEVKIDCVTACSKAKQEVPVFVSKQARQKAMLFMKWAKAREWLAYLVGEKKEDGSYDITDLHLPDQRTSATLVDRVNAADYNSMTIVGVIHSHHEMGAGDEDKPSFSGHDSEFINSNHNLSLLAGLDRKKGGFKVVGIARVETPCGSLMKVKAVVRPMKEEISEKEKSLQDEFKEKVFGRTNAGLAGKEVELGGQNGFGYQQRQMVDYRCGGRLKRT